MYKHQIETPDLILAKAKMSDLNDMYENCWSQEEAAKYMLWKPCKNLDDAKARLLRSIEIQKDKIAYFVYEKKSNQAIGMAGMIEIEPNVYEDGGIVIGPAFVGKGYGKQILMALINYCKNELNAKKIICSCDSQNIASARLQQSCGLKYTHSKKMIRERDGSEFKADYYELIF